MSNDKKLNQGEGLSVSDPAGLVKAAMGASGFLPRGQKNDDQDGGRDAAREVGAELKKQGRAAKTVTVAGAKLALGDAVGAAKEVAKNPGAVGQAVKAVGATILIIITLAAFLVSSLIGMLVATPIMIYEHLENFVHESAENFDEIRYSNQYGSSNVFRDSLVWLGSLIGLTDEVNGTVDASDVVNDPSIMYQEESEKLALVNRLYIVDEKLSIRANQIKEGIGNSAAAINDSLYYDLFGEYYSTYVSTNKSRIWSSPKIVVTVEPPLEALTDGAATSERHKTLQRLVQQFENCPSNEDPEALDAWRAEFAENVANGFPSTDNALAMRVLTLYNVQKDASLTDMKVTDFMKYLGYYKTSWLGSRTNTGFDLGGITTAKVVDWEGTFVPQYMMEEIKSLQDRRYHLEQEKTHLEATGGDPSEITRKQAEIEATNTAIEMYAEKNGVALTDLLLEVDFPPAHLGTAYGVVAGTPKTETDRDGTTHYYYTYSNPSDGNGSLTLHKWVVPGSTGGTHYQFEINVYIRPRNISTVADVVGFWDGSFEDSLESAPDEP